MKKIICFILIILMLVFPLSVVHAESLDGVTISGEYSDELTLSCDNNSIFKKSMIAPGDSWSAIVKLKNDSVDKTIDVSLKKITSSINDLRLFNALTLKIYLNKELKYDGMYNPSENPVVDWITILPGEIKYLEVVVAVPTDINNDYQSLKMESIWSFECRASKSETITSQNNQPNSPIKTGVQYVLNNPALLIAFISSILMIVMIIIYVLFKKKKDR